MRASPTFIEVARRRQIIAAAVDVLCDSGFGAASLATIADRVGVSKGVISYYFAGKHELLRAVVSSVLDEAGAFMAPRVAAAPDSRTALREYVSSNLEFIAAHRREIIAFTEIVNGVPPGGAEPPPYGEGHRAAVAALATLLRTGQRRREFGKFAPEVAATALRASIDAVSGILRADPDADLVAYGRELLVLFERAVAR